MKAEFGHQLQRLSGYAAGFILFFAPTALFQRAVLYLLGENFEPTIHTLCFRIPIEHMLSGRFFLMGTAAAAGTILLLGIAFFFGPLFCGKLCPAGAAPEYISKLLPARVKINWSRYVSIPPLRYGYLAGFMAAPLAGGYLACAYCNYYVFDLLVNYSLRGHIVAFSSSLLLTLLFWLFLFGVFTQGGRGFCNFFCPVGALQNLFYYAGRSFSLARSLQVDPDKCINCGICIQQCPMTCMGTAGGTVQSNVHHCILCLECVAYCPCRAIRYGNRKEAQTCCKSIASG